MRAMFHILQQLLGRFGGWGLDSPMCHMGKVYVVCILLVVMWQGRDMGLRRFFLMMG